jgi:hypothetical protein
MTLLEQFDELRVEAWVRHRFGALSFADATRRIEDWYQRGFVHYSDVATRSSRLARVAPGAPAESRPRAVRGAA